MARVQLDPTGNEHRDSIWAKLNTMLTEIYSGSVLGAGATGPAGPTGPAGAALASHTGTFTANGASSVTVTDANVTANSAIIITLKTVGGTVGAIPAIKTITPSTGFTVAGTASDTSTYNYNILG